MRHSELSLTSMRDEMARVTTKDELAALVARVKAAQLKFAGFSQKQVDHIFQKGSIGRCRCSDTPR